MTPSVPVPRQMVFLSCELCDGFHDCCAIRYVVLDEVDGSKKSGCLLEIHGWCQLEDGFDMLLHKLESILTYNKA